MLGSAWRRVEEKRGKLGETELVVVSLVSGWLLVGEAVRREGRMVERLMEAWVIKWEEGLMGVKKGLGVKASQVGWMGSE